jgi:hypothetical protein
MSLFKPPEYNGYVWRPSNGVLYLYDSAVGDEFKFENLEPVMNARKWTEDSGAKGMGSRAASIQSQLVDLTDCFYDTVVPNLREPVTNRQIRFNELADMILNESDRAHDTNDESRAAAVITSLSYPDFQNVVAVGESNEFPIRQGILPGLFESIQLDAGSGKWAQIDDNLIWHNNLPENSTPEPSFGFGTTIPVSIQKHGGAVAITDRAQDIINGLNPFQRLTARLGQKRLADENRQTAAEIEKNTTNTVAGVDFGLRTGTPPASQTYPPDLIKSINTVFDAKKAPWNLFITKGYIYTEYATNDIINGVGVAPPSQGSQNERQSPFPLADGVTWARDNAITSNIHGWALNDMAIKIFRGAIITYTVRNQDHETTKFVIKNNVKPQTVEPSLIVQVLNIAA